MVDVAAIGEAREVAEATVFVATGKGDFIVEHDLVVDGGCIIH